MASRQRCHHPGVVQICSPFPSGSGGGSLKLPSSIFSLKLLLLKICASEQETLHPQSVHSLSGSDLLLQPLPRATRAAQIFVLEFSKDGSADLGDEFADGGVANQPVILQGGVSLSSGQVSQDCC